MLVLYCTVSSYLKKLLLFEHIMHLIYDDVINDKIRQLC